MKFLPSYYDGLDRDLRSLTDQMQRLLSDSEAKWVAEFLDAGEYGLVMTRILECLQRSGASAPRGIVEEARRLALRMNLGDEVAEYLP
jgi:hypothetical protein